MESFFSLASEGFRRIFLAFFAMSVLFPTLILLFIVFQHVYPHLSVEQVEHLRNTFIYGMAAMLSVPLLSFLMMFGWIRLVENLTREVKARSAEVLSEDVKFNEENEIMTIQNVFNSLQQELKDKVSQINDYSQKLIESNMKLSELAITDELTTLHNRRHFDERLIEEASRAERYKRDLALIMIDIDGFKAYNDSYGHPAGDELLKGLGIMIRNAIRKSDIPFRYGGDELAILCPECATECATSTAQKITDLVAAHSFEDGGNSPSRKITISCGIASYAQDMKGLLYKADKCLYEAKIAGKGRIVGSP